MGERNLGVSSRARWVDPDPGPGPKKMDPTGSSFKLTYSFIVPCSAKVSVVIGKNTIL